jgi:hypothetical protein
MSDKWLSAQNFERSFHLVSAINTVSIHSKLEAAGIDDSARLADVEEAQEYLVRFLRTLSPMVRDPGGTSEGLVDGADPRLGDLARGFLAAQTERPAATSLYGVSPEEICRLVESSEPSDQEKLLVCLRDLRGLLEQHIRADAAEVFGEA